VDLKEDGGPVARFGFADPQKLGAYFILIAFLLMAFAMYASR